MFEDIAGSRAIQWLVLVFVVIAGILLVKLGASYIPDRGGMMSATKRVLLGI